MAVKYHINPSKGPLVCTAESPDRCHYGLDAPHFATKEEAEAQFQEDLSSKYGTLTSKRMRNAKSKTEERNSFLKDFENKSIDEIVDFADLSYINHKQVDKIINLRAEKTKNRSEALEHVESRKLMDKKTLSSHKRDFNDYRNRTAELVEAYTESKFYKPSTAKWEQDSIGSAVISDNYPAQSREWHEARYNSVGGSDVGTLASLDFDENPMGYVKASYGRIVKSKTVPMTDENFEKALSLKSSNRGGALYRGTVWESRIRDQYAKDHPECKVYSADGQFSHAERDWQKVNVDGLISDRKDGVPNGILEIKTGSDPKSWKDGVPSSYRAQTLYYLNTTGLEYADVRALINDNETFEHRLYKNDEVVPGCGKNMEEYIQERVQPWFDDLKTKRNSETLAS